jgi:hypothetical protein
MHSQLMFNECIAKTRSQEREDSVHIFHRIHVSSCDCRCLCCVCLFASFVSNEETRFEGGFNILPSSGLGGGIAGHQTASSSEALRRT